MICFRQNFLLTVDLQVFLTVGICYFSVGVFNILLSSSKWLTTYFQLKLTSYWSSFYFCRYKGGPDVLGKLIIKDNHKGFVIDLYPIHLQLFNCRNNILSNIQIDKRVIPLLFWENFTHDFNLKFGLYNYWYAWLEIWVCLQHSCSLYWLVDMYIRIKYYYMSSLVMLKPCH